MPRGQGNRRGHRNRHRRWYQETGVPGWGRERFGPGFEDERFRPFGPGRFTRQDFPQRYGNIPRPPPDEVAAPPHWYREGYPDLPEGPKRRGVERAFWPPPPPLDHDPYPPRQQFEPPPTTEQNLSKEEELRMLEEEEMMIEDHLATLKQQIERIKRDIHSQEEE